MWKDRRFRIVALLALGLFAYLSTSGDGGVLAFEFAQPPEIEQVSSEPENTGYREGNVYYRDCLARRDAGDMKCGEVCYWRECMACANVCTLNCVEGCSCSCSCDACPPPPPPGTPKLEVELPPEPQDYGASVRLPVDDAGDDTANRPLPQATPIPKLDCTDYPSCVTKYGVEIDVTNGRCEDASGNSLSFSNRADCFGGSGYWIGGNLYANYGQGVTIKPNGAYVQPYSFNWDLKFKNNYRGQGTPGIPSAPAHLIELYKFECQVRWTTTSGSSIPGVVDGSWPDQCILGHNTLATRGFYADATECDELYNPGGGCQVTDNPPDAYRLWPVGDYKVELLIDGEVIVQRLFTVEEFPRPSPWPLNAPDERPRNHNRGPVYFSYIGQWPSGLPYGSAYYQGGVDADRCVRENKCSVEHPWDYMLPWGSSGGAYEIRPLWGDYSAGVGDPRSAPEPETHAGFDFVYPQCPRLDLCYQGQNGYADPCRQDSKDCIPDYCSDSNDGNCDNCDSCCSSCSCGCSYGCSDYRQCAWIASCGGCTQWAWRSLGLIGSGAGRPPNEDYPIKYGAGFNVDSSTGDYRTQAGTRGHWERDNTELFNMAADAHLLVDNYLGVAARCKGNRNIGDVEDYVDDDDHIWFPEISGYSWLSPPSGAMTRVKVSERVPEFSNLSTALPSQGREGELSAARPTSIDAGTVIEEPRECEARFRERLEKAFNLTMGLSDVNTVFAGVLTDCADFLSVWNPLIRADATARTGEVNHCPGLDSNSSAVGTGVHPAGTKYRLHNGDGRPVWADDADIIIAAGITPKVDSNGAYALSADRRHLIDDSTGLAIKAIDFVLQRPTLVVHWDPGSRGTGVGGSSGPNQASYSVSASLGGGYIAPTNPPPGTVLKAGSSLAAFASARAQATLPVTGSRCWVFDEVDGWRYFGVQLLDNPSMGTPETESQWQQRTGWFLDDVATGLAAPSTPKTNSYLSLDEPAYRDYQSWNGAQWYAFNTRRTAAGLPAVEVFSDNGGVTLRPRSWVENRFGGPLSEPAAADWTAGIGAERVKRFGASTVHPAQGARFQERFQGYVDTRPAPVFVISWPVGLENTALSYDGPKSDPGPVNYAVDADHPKVLEHILAAYKQSIASQFKLMTPDPLQLRSGYTACDDSSSARHNHVLGWRMGGELVAFESKPCWVTYSDAIRAPGLYQVVSPPSGTSLQSETFPLMRIRDPKSGGPANPVPAGAQDDDSYSAAYDARGDCSGGTCPEPGVCIYQDHRGMLKTNFTLQQYPQYVGESYLGQSRVTSLLDSDGKSYDSLLVVARDSAESSEDDHYEALNEYNSTSALNGWRIENGNVLVYQRKEGFTSVTAELPWTGYRTLPNGHLEYTDRLGYRTEINPDLLGGCRPVCPYLENRRETDRRPLLSGASYQYHPYGGTLGFSMSAPRDQTCNYDGDGPIICNDSARHEGSLGFSRDMPYPYCPYVTADRTGQPGMATMERYVFPKWDYTAPEDYAGRVVDDDPVVRDDRDRLVELYLATNGDYWINNRHWLSARPIGEWYGVDASGGTVQGLDLSYNRLRGNLPGTFGELTSITDLNLSHNELGGSLPTNFTNLVNMVELDLSTNGFTGSAATLEAIFKAMTGLRYLDIGHNAFSGGFPDGTHINSGIESIDFSHNDFTDDGQASLGPWCPPYGNLLPALFRLELKGNSLKERCVSASSTCLANTIPSHDLASLWPGYCKG